MERKKLDMLCMKMTAHDVGDPRRVQHFMKVSSFAALIGRLEGLDEHTLFVLEAAGLVHDIGIRPAEEKYGYENGQLQQELGPDAARPMLLDCGFDEAETERICYLIAHHHMYDNIDGADYQILIEADFLVNLYENHSGRDAVQHVYDTIFKTAAGKELCRLMFLKLHTEPRQNRPGHDRTE